MQWYCLKDGRQEGPVEESEIFRMARNGHLRPRDLVWNQTMGDKWVEASTVPGLFGAPAPSVPAGAPVSPPGGGIRDVSCTAPVGPAWERMKEILFSPFDLGKWFTLGFSAWLATLGQGGKSFNFGGGGEGSRMPFDSNALKGVQEFIMGHGAAIAWGIALVIVVVMAIGLAVLWVSSRGKFMFLDNVVNNRDGIVEPWRTFKAHGNSLFLWRLVYGLLCFLAILLIAAIVILGAVIPGVRVKGFDVSMIPAIVAAGFLFIVFAVVAGYIARFLEDFIVPMMYKFDLTAMEAWGRFIGLLKANFWKFIVYGLFYALLSIAAVVCVLIAVLVTCCIAGCLLAIPYVGAVVLLPVTVFFRVYSIEYLSQFGEEYGLSVNG